MAAMSGAFVANMTAVFDDEKRDLGLGMASQKMMVAVAVTLMNEPIAHSCFISACMNIDPRCLARW